MYNSSRELAQKADYEGGLDGMIFGYGLSLDELPDDMPEEIYLAIQRVLEVKEDFDRAARFLDEAMDSDPVPGDWDYEETDG